MEIHEGVGRTKQKHKMEIKALRDKWKNEISKTKNKTKKNEFQKQFTEEEKVLVQKHAEEFNKHDQTNDSFEKREGCVDDVEKELYLYVKKEEIKLSKTQKKKNKKKEKEIQQRIAIDQETAQMPKYGEIEMERINEKLKTKNLKVQSVAADGHCLYRALENQLCIAEKIEKKNEEEKENEKTKNEKEKNEEEKKSDCCTYMKLREIAANFIIQNSDFFLHFFDECYQHDAERFAEYCTKIKETAEWGGEIELQALSQALQRFIVVYAENHVYKYGEDFQDESKMPLRLSFHTKLISLGAHYNSVVPIDFFS